MPDVRFGSKADMCSASIHVRFTPNSDIDCAFRRGAQLPPSRSALAHHSAAKAWPRRAYSMQRSRRLRIGLK